MAHAPTRGARLGHADVFAAIAAISFLAARFLPLLGASFTCPFKAATGLPCASCGMTHAFVLLSRGEVAAALAASPLGALLAALAWAYAALDLVRLAAGVPFPRVGERALRLGTALGLLAVFANWGWLLLAARGAR